MKKAIDTNILNIIDIIGMIDSGELKLPDFQRDYNWGKGKVKKLMDTIQKKHPSGSLLFLKNDCDNPIVNERCFMDVSSSEKKTEYLVLDGQQRLTSCYHVYHNKGNRSYYLNLKALFNKYKNNELEDVDLDEDKIIEDRKHKDIPDGELNEDLFPMGCFNDKNEFKSVLTKYKKTIKDKESEYFAFIDEKFELFCDSFFDYQFPIIILPKDLSLDAVCKVFQTINTTALKLSAYDICVAKFMRFSINLKQKIEDAITDYPNIKIIADKDKTIILQTVALLNNISPKMNNLANNLDETSFNKWSKAIKGLNKTIDLLNDFGVGCDKSLSLLPYQPFIALFGAVLPEVEYWNLDAIKRATVENKLKQFFYFASLSGRYNEGTDNKMKEDYILLCRWILNDDVISYMTHGIDWNRDKMKTAKKGSAMGKIILCLLNRKNMKDFYTDNSVGIGGNRVASDIHHIFPKAAYSNIDKDFIDSIFNQTFITSVSNRNIKDKSTDKYLEEIISKIKKNNAKPEESLKSRLIEHFISSNAYTAMRNQDFYSFINEREQSIRNELETEIGLTINLIDNSMVDDDSDDDSFIDTEE